MAKSVVKRASNLFVWLILGLLFVALAGFGIGSFTGGSSRVGSVGDAEITAQDYALALQQELRAQIERTQRPLGLADLQAAGIDQAVLQSLIARAALTNEAAQMGLSVGDEEVAERVRSIEGFQGIDGNFDMQTYEFQLSSNGLSISDFEQDLREEAARNLLQVAVVGGLNPNPVYAETLVAYQGETRDFSILTITEADLPGGLPAPRPEDLEGYYEENPQRFTRPEAKRIEYVWLTPTMILDGMVIEEETLRELYEDRAALYIQPERRLAERLPFFDAAAAEAALAAIEAGETTFDDLVAERGLTLEDVDLGDVAAADLPEAAAEVLFAEERLGLYGPLESSLGPALYRVNAVLSASEVSFEEAQEELRAEIASDLAVRAIADMREEVEDLLAGGATLAELSDETDFVLGEIDFSAGADSGIAAYDAFRAAAEAVTENDFPEMLELSDGGLFAIELIEIVPPTLPAFADIEAEVEAAWRATTLREQLAARGETLRGTAGAGAALDDLGRVTQETGVRRSDPLPGAPPTLVAQVFQLGEVGDLVMVPGADRALVVRLDAITPAARDGADTGLLLQIFSQTIAQSYAQDVFEAYGRALQADAGIQIDQAVINAVHASFQ